MGLAPHARLRCASSLPRLRKSILPSGVSLPTCLPSTFIVSLSTLVTGSRSLDLLSNSEAATTVEWSFQGD